MCHSTFLAKIPGLADFVESDIVLYSLTSISGRTISKTTGQAY